MRENIVDVLKHACLGRAFRLLALFIAYGDVLATAEKFDFPKRMQYNHSIKVSFQFPFP